MAFKGGDFVGEITAVFDDVKDVVGDKGFLILGAVAAGLFAINLLKKDDNSDATGNTLVQASGYTSYPSVEQNANVVIDTLQNSIDYAQGSIMEQNKENYDNTQESIDNAYNGMSESLGELGNNIQDMNNDMRDFLQDNFEATNNYINSGLAAQAALINMNNSQLKDSIENMGNTLRTSVNDAKNELANRADTNTEIVVQKINSANSSTGNKKPAKQKIQSGSSSGNKKPLPTNRKPRPVRTGKNKDGKKKIKTGSATTSKK